MNPPRPPPEADYRARRDLAVSLFVLAVGRAPRPGELERMLLDDDADSLAREMDGEPTEERH